MAFITGLNVHQCTSLKAVAEYGDDSSWLTISFDVSSALAPCLTVFMPLERARRLADAINAADSQSAPILDEVD